MDEAMFAATDVLTLIKARFADRDALIERTFRHDASFRSLCEDYRDCVFALERLQKTDSPATAARRGEYAELLEELGCEIRDWLSSDDQG
jgi:hypothetical protein